MASCSKDHTGDVPAAVIASLPSSQAGDLRHRCAFCAYLEGRRSAEESIKRLRIRVRELEDELATHKSAE